MELQNQFWEKFMTQNKAPWSSNRGKIAWLGVTLFLAGSLGLANWTRGQEAALATAQMAVRGPNEAIVGQPFTIEILITNAGGADLKELKVLAAMDTNLDQKAGGGEHLAKVDAIAPGKIHIVRLTLTATKKGPAGIDITLSNKAGESRQIRHVLPVFPAEDAPPQAERPNGASPLKVTITSPKQFFVGQNATFLLYVLNTDSRATPEQQLIVSYASGSGVNLNNPAAPIDFNRAPEGPGPEGPRRKGVGIGFAGVLTNPTRQVRLALPALAPNEGRTVPVEIMPRRLGDLHVVVASNNLTVGSIKVQAAFDPAMPMDKFLPGVKTTGVSPQLPRNLADVPEVALEDPLARSMNPGEAFEHIAGLIDRINFLNAKKTDAFVEGLIQHRDDVHGLPFAMGHSCRLQMDRANHFVTELATLRVALSQVPSGNGLAGKLPNPLDNNHGGMPARVAAMFQVLGPEGAQMRQEMAKYLGSVSHADATKVLAKLAIFSDEAQVRQVALDALKTRNDKDYTDILVQGMSYPWPQVAERTSEAIVKLKRTDLLTQLADSLDKADPRSPQMQDVDGKKVNTVREVVKINHLRNCILCHSPRTPDQQAAVAPALEGRGAKIGVNGVLVANVPIPNQALPPQTFSGGYGQSFMPETMVRFDVTYLRQDFSLMLPVANAQPWPATQRFDFLVRSRAVSEQDAQAIRNLLQPAGQSPYQLAALSALRQLTGRDAEPNAQAWRRVLESK